MEAVLVDPPELRNENGQAERPVDAAARGKHQPDAHRYEYQPECVGYTNKVAPLQEPVTESEQGHRSYCKEKERPTAPKEVFVEIVAVTGHRSRKHYRRGHVQQDRRSDQQHEFRKQPTGPIPKIPAEPEPLYLHVEYQQNP